MPHISYVDPATVDDPELQAIMERARANGTPRPESQAIRLHHPEVMKAFNNAWEVFFRQGVADHAIKELCRLYIAKSVECEYCGGQRSVLAQQQGASEAQVDEIQTLHDQRWSSSETARRIARARNSPLVPGRGPRCARHQVSPSQAHQIPGTPRLAAACGVLASGRDQRCPARRPPG